MHLIMMKEAIALAFAAIALSTKIGAADPQPDDIFQVPEKQYGACFESNEETKITNAEFEMIAQVVMNEEGHSSFEAKQAVAEVIMNRVNSSKFPDTVYEVIHQPNQFSTRTDQKPNQECYDAVVWALQYNAFPDDLYWFRLSYVSYGHLYMRLNNTYFSTENDYSSLED